MSIALGGAIPTIWSIHELLRNVLGVRRASDPDVVSESD